MSGTPSDIFRPEQAGVPRLGRALAGLRREAGGAALVALGGGLGSLARYAVAWWLPTGDGGFPWSTFVVNVSGCALIGVLMVYVSDVWASGRYARLFFGVGLLGGYTTYSTMMLDLRTLGSAGDWLTADLYLLGSLIAGLGAVALATIGTRALTGGPTRRRGYDDGVPAAAEEGT